MMHLALTRARDQACDLLREMILTGELAPAAHVEEIKLSEQIGVSRTPVREALIALEQEGLVSSNPRKGFVVVGANEALVREVFPIIAALEVAAVRQGADKLISATAKLSSINRMLTREHKRARRYELDRAFHTALTEPCGNKRLLHLLDMERARMRLIDGAHHSGLADPEGSVAEHESIIVAIERENIEQAAQRLEQHWHDGIEVVAKWFQQRS
jgi:DNA-binding GntR family transcriptional regulator